MPGAEFAQYGLAVFAVAGLIYLVDRWMKSKADNELTEVVENNTKALENLTTIIRVNLTRQEAKIYVRNFRVYYDIVSNLDTMVVLD